eukprot:2563809-Rhodomonas_salina.2
MVTADPQTRLRAALAALTLHPRRQRPHRHRDPLPPSLPILLASVRRRARARGGRGVRVARGSDLRKARCVCSSQCPLPFAAEHRALLLRNAARCI